MPEHQTIYQQDLWKHFQKRAEPELVTAVKTVCECGLGLSRDIIRFFPNYTLHDETHSANVCRWMWSLLGTRAKKLSVNEAALLLMAACCHDIGMTVDPDQEEQMRLRTYPGWDDYFRKNLSDAEEFDRTKTISNRMLRNFVRLHHHERVEDNLKKAGLVWPQALNLRGIGQDTLVAVCKSHGQNLDRIQLTYEANQEYDMLMCAVLLRLADMLDYDMDRAPDALFLFHGLDQPQGEEQHRSAREQLKNRVGCFGDKIKNGIVSYQGEFEDPVLEYEVREYLKWVVQEMQHCEDELRQSASDWNSLGLPHRIDTRKIKTKGYESGDFSMTMDQDRIIDLLRGENLYSDSGVFVRELLQNSIDAVLLRAKKDPKFPLEKGLVQIDSWRDAKTGDTWFRIRDNGTGMNRKIIKKHFLKVGNSYYTSEEFLHENRQGKPGSYTAISRFGIGILSCFMCDKDRTELKVATKRFDEGKKCGIRLDVTGLHGQYFLSSEEKHKDYVENFRKMPSPDSEDQGFREEPGTTICVRTSLIRMGETRSFREILDKYVQFPEVRVTYNGPEGYKEYPRQQELMEAVYALNPDGKIREYVYEIPDEDFERLKRSFPYHIFEERPRVILRYEPLDRLSDSEKLTGVRIWAEVTEPKVRIREVEDQELRNALEVIKIEVRIESIHEAGVRIRYWLDGSADVPRGIAPKDGVFFTLVEKNQSLRLSPAETRLWELCFGAIRGSKAKRKLIAYNGVLAQTDKDTSYLHDNTCFVMLLREEFLPRVNMARNEITGIPTEAACCMAMAGLEDAVPGKLWKLATERELLAILDRHPGWAGMLQAKEMYSVSLFSPRTALWLAHWKRQCQVSFLYMGLNSVWHAVTEEKPDGRTADFPAAMFCELERDVLCHTWMRDSHYDPSHPFSRWLIEHRAALEEQVPNLYDTMIKTMMLTDEVKKIRDVLNTSLELLRKMEGNPFQVPADLILTKEDFR